MRPQSVCQKCWSNYIAKKYTNDYLRREYDVQARRRHGHALIGDQKQKLLDSAMFSHFGDRLLYDGRVPTGKIILVRMLHSMF